MPSSPLRSQRDLLLAGRYRIARKLGAGRLGTVYLARDEASGRLLALKVLNAERLGEEGVAAIQEEFKAIAGLHHPQIATAYDFGYTEERRLPFYTREYVEGTPLAAGPPPPSKAAPAEYLKPFLDLLDALHYLHSHEILHLDIHPGNVIEPPPAGSGSSEGSGTPDLDSDPPRHSDRHPDRGAVLIDFGLLRPLQAAGPSLLVRLHPSAAPELLCEEPAGPPADLYAVGRLLLLRLTGSAEGRARLPREIPGWGPRLTLELERIVGKAIQPDPERRFCTAAEFRETLARALGASGPRARVIEPRDVTVGRDPQLEAIEEALRRASEGGAAALWFSGPDGMGKTRLVTEARLRAQLRGIDVVEARFLGNFPEGPEGPSLARALRAHRGGGRRTDWVAALAVEHGGSTAERAARAAEAFFLQGGPPLALLLDGVEAADRESRLLAEALLRECAARQARGASGRGLALIAGSVEGPPGVLAPTERARVAVRLEPLGAKTSEELLRTLLRPLEAPRAFTARVARLSRGIPLRIRRAARVLHALFGEERAIPSGAEIPAAILAPGTSLPRLDAGSPESEVLGALAVLDRPAEAEDLRAATALPPDAVRRALRRLRAEEIVDEHREGRARRFHLLRPEAARELQGDLPEEARREIHERLVAFLRPTAREDPRLLGKMARHLLGAGRLLEGRRTAFRAAEGLRSIGARADAIRILSEASALETEGRSRIRFAEALSALLRETHDHDEAIRVLEPACRGDFGPLDADAAVRVRRALGVHFHRAGQAERALALFRETREIADPRSHLEDLIFVESELAELHTLRNRFDEAEAACRRGLDLLSRLPAGKDEFRGSMEVMLRASLGHLELRRMRLDRAKEELDAAARLAETRTTTDVRARILNNLGIVHNHLNELARARAYYHRSRKLLERVGDQRGIILADCNLAAIAAKLGDADAAARHLDSASALIVHFPGKRLEFFEVLSRGMVAHAFGDPVPAADAFAKAIPIGRELGDLQFVSFAEIYLAEAQVAAGRYGDAARTLRGAAARARTLGSAVLERMAEGRLLALGELLGGGRPAASAARALDGRPRTDLSLLEAWTDLAAALAAVLAGRPARDLFAAALETFAGIGIPAGRRLARAGLLGEAVRDGETPRIRAIVREIETESAAEGPSPHKLLSVLEPLVRAEACLSLGEPDRSEDALDEAAGAIVGLPFLELDWRIEHLRARLAEARGERDAARRHVHRSLHTRDLLARSVPAASRARFLSHPRFAALAAFEDRLRKARVHLLGPVGPPQRAGAAGLPRHPGTLGMEIAAAPGIFEGMVGRSEAMEEVFETIRRLADKDIPVLIRGETGTGKELVARALHATSSRRKGPFLALHCASLPTELFESELFGYEAGAFTGAEEARSGILEHLDGGTLLLDEIGGLGPETQTKLLRVLDARVIRPLGGLRTRRIDVRFLAATSADVEEGIRTGSFRPDLYWRLAGVEIAVPSLRARKEDIPDLAAHFLRLHARRLEFGSAPRILPDALRILGEHDWPGNVRELETVLVRALVAASPHGYLEADAIRRVLPRPARRSLFPPEAIAGRDLRDLRRELESAYLGRLFRDTGGDLARMAETLGVTVSNLYHWLKKVGLDIRALRRGD